jgi:hypothetical protein
MLRLNISEYSTDIIIDNFNIPNCSQRNLFGLNISGVPRNFVRGEGGGVQQMQLRTEDSENGDLGAVTP